MRCNNRIPILIILLICFLFSGCNVIPVGTESNGTDTGCSVSAVDYSDWYGDINDTGIYNLTKWIELDIWFDGKISEADYPDVTYDVYFEGELIETGLAAAVEMNYIKCRFDRTNEGVLIAENGYFEPGNYEIALKDNKGNVIVSSACSVTAETGDILSGMVIDSELLADQADQLALRVFFGGDITPYSKLGFYVVVSLDDGKTEFVPESFSVEPADTYLTVRIFDPDLREQKVLVSLFCKDGSLVFADELGA